MLDLTEIIEARNLIGFLKLHMEGTFVLDYWSTICAALLDVDIEA